MKKYLPLRSFIVILITAVIVSFLLFYDFGNSDSRIIDAILSFGHLVLFGVVSLVILWNLNQVIWQHSGKNLYLRAWVITSLLGVLTECIQAFTPYRHFRIRDILTDALGSAVFLSFSHSLKKGANLRSMIIMRNGLLLFMIIRAYPIFSAAADTWSMKMDFPLLSSFESSFEMSRWTNKESTMERTRLHSTDGMYSLQVHLNPGVYPGISLDYTTNDWRGYGILSFDIFLMGDSSLEIILRINDREHNNKYVDRFNRSLVLHSGANHIFIKLDEVKMAPQGRKMDMANITNICIFAYKLNKPRTVYFDNFRLEK